MKVKSRKHKKMSKQKKLRKKPKSKSDEPINKRRRRN